MNGRDTGFEKKTRPMLAGMYANAYLTHLMTTSSNHDACCTKGFRSLYRVKKWSWMKPRGSFTTVSRSGDGNRKEPKQPELGGSKDMEDMDSRT
jgi:hypothetical protein